MRTTHPTMYAYAEHPPDMTPGQTAALVILGLIVLAYLAALAWWAWTRSTPGLRAYWIRLGRRER